LVTCCEGTGFRNTLLKEWYKGRKDLKEDISSYWMTLRNGNILKTERGNTRQQ
jgi:hypothetical protein